MTDHVTPEARVRAALGWIAKRRSGDEWLGVAEKMQFEARQALPVLDSLAAQLEEAQRAIVGVKPLVATSRCLRRPARKDEPDPGPCGKCAPCLAARSLAAYDEQVKR